MTDTHPILLRARAFCERFGLRVPILLAPMAGACPSSLSIAVANAGGLGACGALMMQPDEIRAWSDEFRKGSQGEFQINLWIPDTPPARDFELEKRQREFLTMWGPPVAPEAGDATLPDFEAQCQTMLTIAPKVISSIIGLYAPAFVSELKARGILWFANATTVAEAKAAEEAGADAIVAQGMEAGGHRGAFQASEAERQMVGLMALLPQAVDAVNVPVIATGGIADPRGIAAALILGASAVQIGTIPAISGSEDARCLCRQTCMHRGPRNDDYACIQRAARAQRSDRIRPSSDRSECSASSTVSCPARINSRNAGSCTASWRFRSYAIVGGPVGQVSAGSTSGGHRSAVVERGIAATVVIEHASSH